MKRPRGRPRLPYRPGDLVRVAGTVGIYLGPVRGTWGRSVVLQVGPYETVVDLGWGVVEVLERAQLELSL